MPVKYKTIPEKPHPTSLLKHYCSHPGPLLHHLLPKENPTTPTELESPESGGTKEEAQSSSKESSSRESPWSRIPAESPFKVKGAWMVPFPWSSWRGSELAVRSAQQRRRNTECPSVLWAQNEPTNTALLHTGTPPETAYGHSLLQEGNNRFWHWIRWTNISFKL